MCAGDLHLNSILVEDDGSTKGVVEKGDVDVTVESSLECQPDFIAGEEESIKAELCVVGLCNEPKRERMSNSDEYLRHYVEDGGLRRSGKSS